MGWAKVVGSLRAPTRNPSTILNATLSATLPLVPSVTALYSATFVMAEGIKFAQEVREEGLESAVRKAAMRLPRKVAASTISDSLWDAALRKAPPDLMAGPYAKLAERAFKRTLSSIMTRGVRALGEEQ